MGKPLFLFTDDVVTRATRYFTRHYKNWLLEKSCKPFVIPLGVPTERVAMNNLTILKNWIAHWQNWQGTGDLIWETRSWQQLGKQTLPINLVLATIDNIVLWAGKKTQWALLKNRYRDLVSRWPHLTEIAPKRIDILAKLKQKDYNILLTTLTWLSQHSAQSFYLRQLPISGMHTKWLEQRKSLISELLPSDLNSLSAIKPEPKLIRLKVLDEKLRQQVGGLNYLCAPIDELAQLNLAVKNVFIVENIQTGLAFGDQPNAVVIMGLGYSVNVLANIPWIHQATCYYWGDIDTHGFAILNIARMSLNHLTSLFMDQQTLFSVKEFWGIESQPLRTEKLTYLTPDETNVYQALRDNIWGEHIRFEQEQFHWPTAWEVIHSLKT